MLLNYSTGGLVFLPLYSATKTYTPYNVLLTFLYHIIGIIDRVIPFIETYLTPNHEQTDTYLIY